MNNELMKVGQTYVAKTDTTAMRKDVGGALMKTGGAGLVLGGLAWLIPFVTLPMLLVVAVVLGAYIYAK